MRAARLLALALLLPPVALAGSGGEPPAGSIRRSIEVRVTNLDVVVTDRRGARVPGLTREDFEVFEEGVRRTVTNFSAVGAAAGAPSPAAGEPAATPAPSGGAAPPAPSQPPQSWLVVFVDNLHLSVPHRNRAIRQVRDLVGRAAASGVAVLVVTAERSPKIRQKFTTDAALLSRALDEIALDSAAGARAEASRRSTFLAIDTAIRDLKFASAEGFARAFAEEEAADVDASFRSLRATLDQLAALEGRKVLVHVSEGLPLSPGADAYEYLRSAYADRGRSRTGVVRAAGLDRGAKLQELAEAANAARVTLHAIDAAGLSRDEPGPGIETMLAPMGRVEPFRARGNVQAPLSYLAEETGGTAILNQSVIARPLAQVEEDLGSFYSLGYESPRPDEDATRSVEVRVKRPGLVARARRTFRVKSDDTRVGEGVASALFFGRPENPFGASVEIGEPRPRGARAAVPLRIRVPADRLPGAPGAGRLVIYIMVRDEEDRTSDLVRQEKEVHPGVEVVHETLLKMRRGRQVISLGIRDVATGLASYLQRTVSIPVK